MYSDKFLRAVDFTLRWEGSEFEDDPDDAGGATKFGIDSRSHPGVDIRHLTRDGAIAIYHNEYWNKMRCEELPSPVAEVVFDIGVNNGTGRAAKWLQREVGTEPDGVIGPFTIEATNLKDPREVAMHLALRRDAFYEEIARGRQAKFLNGWLNRNADLKTLIA